MGQPRPLLLEALCRAHPNLNPTVELLSQRFNGLSLCTCISVPIIGMAA